MGSKQVLHGQHRNQGDGLSKPVKYGQRKGRKDLQGAGTAQDERTQEGSEQREEDVRW